MSQQLLDGDPVVKDTAVPLPHDFPLAQGQDVAAGVKLGVVTASGWR